MNIFMPAFIHTMTIKLLDEAAVMFVIYVKALSVSSAATVRAAARPHCTQNTHKYV